MRLKKVNSHLNAFNSIQLKFTRRGFHFLSLCHIFCAAFFPIHDHINNDVQKTTQNENRLKKMCNCFVWCRGRCSTMPRRGASEQREECRKIKIQFLSRRATISFHDAVRKQLTSHFAAN